MTDNSEVDRYIKCSKCKRKYKNETDFGNNRLGERYKTCVSCRTKNKNHVNTKKEEDSVIPIEEKETIDRYITDINHWDREEKKYVDEVNGDIRPLLSNPRYAIVKKISDGMRMECFMKYKHDLNIIKYIESNIQLRNMGYKHPIDLLGEHMLHTMFESSSDEDDLRGGKRN